MHHYRTFWEVVVLMVAVVGTLVTCLLIVGVGILVLRVVWAEPPTASKAARVWVWGLGGLLIMVVRGGFQFVGHTQPGVITIVEAYGVVAACFAVAMVASVFRKGLHWMARIALAIGAWSFGIEAFTIFFM